MESSGIHLQDVNVCCGQEGQGLPLAGTGDLRQGKGGMTEWEKQLPERCARLTKYFRLLYLPLQSQPAADLVHTGSRCCARCGMETAT